ncbi:IPT/TIG domain-containing protein [Brevundimonas faecalis]|uniref:IPT/TIG domain-containing protein n=1 Tax=Brevundimonas faecalis TaxID=947378 RepID=UPI0033972D86
MTTLQGLLTNQSTHAARASWYNGGAKYFHGSAEQVTVNATINGTGLNARLYRGASSNSIGTLVNGTNLSASGTITYALNSAEFALESRIVGASAPDGTVTITATCTAPVPIISGISPASGPTGGGTNVTLTGSYLANASMTLDGATVTPTYASDTSIVFTTPAHAAGAVTVSLTTPGGSASNSFTYVSAPTVTSISPTAGPTGGGTTVIITGTGFSTAGSTGAVKFGAANATYAINSNTQITATSPANSAGTYDITVTTPGGTSAVSAADQFTYVPAPTVTSISSTSGPSSGGTTVTITGTNFSGATAVAFGGVAATGYTVLSGTSIAATAPAGTGTVDIRVTTTGGTSATSAADQYTYIPAPTVNAISPMAGPTAGGTSVTITGANFTGVTAVTFGGSAAVGFTLNSASSITAVAPSGTGTADIRVTTPGGTSATSAADRFAYLAPITLSPAAGALPGGTARNAYSRTLTASGGSTPYTFSFTGSLPSGLTLSAGGVLSGTPTASGTFNFTINVSDNSAAAAGSAFTASQSYSITIVKAAQTINFGPLSNVSLSASPVSVLATADSGLTVGFTSSTTGVCTVSGGSVTLLDLGVCTINADQAGDAAYEVAPTVTQSFTVTPATLTINSAAAAGLQVGVGYSQANTAAGGLTPYTYSLSAGAFVPGTSVDTATGVVSGTPTVAGSFSYIVRVTDGQPLFADTGVTTVNIARGNQTISFTSTAPVGASVGGGAYNVTATASSGLTPTVLIDASAAAVCSISGGSVTFQSMGTCVINANQAGDPNWNAASQVQQSFSVGAAAAISSSISFSSSSLGVGETGVATITFTNPNASASPSIAPLFNGSALVSRGGALGGSCSASGWDIGANFQFNGFSIPSGSCTVTISYTGVTAGSTSGFVLGAFTPSGYPATSATGGAGFAVVPTVTGVSPNSGPGSQVTTISGTGFSTTPGNNTVAFGAAGPGVITAASATSLTVTAPAVGSGPMAVTVSVNGQTSTTSGVFTFINAPIAGDKTGVAVPYNSTGAAIDLSGSISGGPHNSIAIGTAAQHGTTTITGDVATYTPTAGYFGADSFTYTATGVGGTSNVATVSIIVATPAAPVAADKSGVAIPYNGTGTAIDLSGSITGVHASIAIATAPAHGSVSVAGDVITYTPTAAYYGADSFTYTATGPGGTSVPATVSLTVATPPAPVVADKNGVAIPYNGTGTAIDLSGAITGVHASIAIATAPAHGSVSVAGDVITYTPTAAYYGADSFTYTATGPGGTSAPATVSLTVATPAAPVAADKNGVAIPYNGAGTAIDLSGSVTGVHASIAIATAPAHGSVSVAGDVITYTPAATYYGADSFTYTATGPGGTSAPATVSIIVATPAAPVAADKNGVAIPYNGAGTAIDLSGSVTGVHASIAIATAPAHGSVSVAGEVITYTPAANYYGVDSFTYTATGPGGVSAPATVGVVVATPAAPVAADKSGVAIPYNGAGTAIDLSGSVTGVHASIAIATAPAHGSASVAGDVITYTPAATYYGADSFTYTATGPGGASAPATVSLTVATPPAPVVTPPADPVAVPPSQGGGSIAVDLGAVSQGVVDGFRITVTSLHGAAELIEGGQAGLASVGRSAAPRAVGGVRLVYTPVANFMGTDTVTVVAYGPGGDSAPVTFTFQVAGKAPDLTAAIASNAVVRLSPTAGLVGGPFNAVRITRPPAFGTATVDGLDIVFTPGAANGGATSLDYVVDLPFGSSAAGRIDLTSNLVPGAQALTAETLQGVPVTVRISNTVGGPFTGAAVVSINPANAGTAVVTGAGAEWNLTFTPDDGFSGQAVATFSLTNAAGTTNGTLAIAVEARPDPSQNVEVRGVATAQVTSARRFADAQLNNFQRRLQALHDGTNGSSNGLSLNLGFGGRNDLDNDPRAALRRQFGGRDQTDPGAMDDRSRDMLGLDIWADRKVGSEAADISADRRGAQSTSGGSGRGPEGGSAVGFWTAGAVDWGRQDADGQRDYRFSTQGVTAGLDVRVSDRLIVGGGLGYGEDKTKVGDNGSISRGSALTGALYASWRPAEAFYIDGVVGYADLDFDARRWTEGLGGQPDGYSASERSGDVRFASSAFGRLLRGGGMTTDLYARVDAREIALDGFTETGGGYGSLIWDEVEQSSLSANLGAAWRWTVETRRYGRITPSARVEWSHELEDVGMQGVRYADWAASPTYLVPLDAWSRNAINVNLGAEWSLTDQLMFSLGYRSNLGDASTSHGAEIRLKYGW